MKLVVDSNVLFTFFWKESVFRSVLCRSDIQLFAPDYALAEIKKHAGEIIRKTDITKAEFERIKEDLCTKIRFFPLEHYANQFKKFKLPDEHKIELLGDIDFLALALNLGCSLWSNDELLKTQSSVIVLSTKDLINLLS